ncbi:MAG TPA: RNA-binding protein [Vicinamibacterales bacterium]|nr:RNA-binding protein [Vicinamibacterales bacterium]
MNRKLYVGNFPFATTERELREAFSQAGAVEKCNVVNDKDTGRPRGYGFVTMATEADALAAIQRFDGTDFGGRTLVVSPAKESPRPDGTGSGRRDDREYHRREDRRDRRSQREARW